MPDAMEFVSLADQLLRQKGFEHFGWTALEKPLSIDFYRQWLAQGHNASMNYLKEHLPLKEDPKRWSPRAQSALVIAKRYHPHPYGPQALKSKNLRVAMYAEGVDYHFNFKQELEEIAAQLREAYPSDEFLCFTDSAPILERDLAYRAGLGWIGKNSCLIHPKEGSLFFIGQILSSLPSPASNSGVPDHCGTCDRCIRACPTQAIESPRTLNANKCISFWTIESREAAPLKLRTHLQDWFFGCDICQTVCPWNEKVFGRENMRQQSAPREIDQDLIEDLKWILSSSHNEIQRRLKDSPLLRARPIGLKRNAIVVIGNQKISALADQVKHAGQDERLKEIAEWALSRLTF